MINTFPKFPDKLSEEQINKLIGLLLGDGSLICTRNNPILHIDRSTIDIEYLKYELNIFKNICSINSKINFRKPIKCSMSSKNTLYTTANFSTRSCPLLLPYYKKWYINGKKIIPNDLVLDKYIILYWLLDDGCVRQRTGNPSRLILVFCSEGFSRDENEFLSKLLQDRYNEKFLVQAKGHNYPGQYRIVAHDATTKILLHDIDDIFPDFIIRKAKWRNPEVNFYNNKIDTAPNYANRTHHLIKEEIFINLLKNKMKTSELFKIVNEKLLLSSEKEMSLDYMRHYIKKLYLRGLLKRIKNENEKEFIYFV